MGARHGGGSSSTGPDRVEISQRTRRQWQRVERGIPGLAHLSWMPAGPNSLRSSAQEVGTDAWAVPAGADTDYEWDVAGFLVCRGALRDTVDPLERQPVVCEQVARIFGTAHFSASMTPPPPRSSSQPVVLHGCAVRGGSRDFLRATTATVCRDVTALWVLDKTAVQVLTIPGSHKSLIEAPADAFSRTDAVRRVTLECGDVLIAAAGTMLALACERLQGRADDPEPGVQICKYHCDVGQSTEAPEVAAGWFAEAPQPAAPDGELLAAADPVELWLWDLAGFLVLHGLMDDQWSAPICSSPDSFSQQCMCRLAAANATVDQRTPVDSMVGYDAPGEEARLDPARGPFEPGAFVLSPEEVHRANENSWPAGTSARLKGHGDGEVLPRRRMGGLYMLPGAEGEPFRRMMHHPEITQRLDWMMNRGWAEVRQPTRTPPPAAFWPRRRCASSADHPSSCCCLGCRCRHRCQTRRCYVCTGQGRPAARCTHFQTMWPRHRRGSTKEVISSCGTLPAVTAALFLVLPIPSHEATATRSTSSGSCGRSTMRTVDL